MRDRIPSDGFAIVFQLCCWYPIDSRLYWLLGETLNVLGHIDQAAEIMDELVRNGRSGLFRDLPLHRRVLRDALPAYRELRDPIRRGQLMSQMLVIPRPLFGGGVGEVAYTAGSCATIGAMAHFSKVVIPGADGGQLPTRRSAPTCPSTGGTSRSVLPSAFLCRR